MCATPQEAQEVNNERTRRGAYTVPAQGRWCHPQYRYRLGCRGANRCCVISDPAAHIPGAWPCPGNQPRLSQHPGQRSVRHGLGGGCGRHWPQYPQGCTRLQRRRYIHCPFGSRTAPAANGARHTANPYRRPLQRPATGYAIQRGALCATSRIQLRPHRALVIDSG